MVKKRVVRAMRKLVGYARIDPLAFALALGILSAVCMLICGIVGMMGFWPNTMIFITEFYYGFDLNIPGILLGIVYGFLDGFIAGYIISLLYNWIRR